MLTATCWFSPFGPSANLAAPIQCNQPSAATVNTTRSDVEGSRSGSMA
jgi:hypothetical protein